MPIGMVALLLVAAPNAELVKARALVHDVQFADAAKVLDLAEARRGNDFESLCEILELQGLVAASLKQTGKARDAFMRLLFIKPDHRFQAKYAPRVMTAYYEARGKVEEHGPLRFLATRAPDRDGAISLTVGVENDRLGLTRTVVVTLREDGAAPREVKQPASAPVRVTSRARSVELSARVLGARDEVLAQLEPRRFDAEPLASVESPVAPVATETKPPPAVSPAAPVVEQAAPSTGVARGRVAGVVLFIAGFAAGGAGAYFGASSRVARSEFAAALETASMTGVSPLTRAEATALSARVQNFAIAANVLWAAAGALALTGLVLWIFGGAR